MQAANILITPDDIEPVIWRRVLVPTHFTLAGLHRVIQAAFDWEDYHLHRFEAGHVRYENPELCEWDPPGKEWADRMVERGVDPLEVRMLNTLPTDERKVRIGDLLDSGVSEFVYLYDFGDDWSHTIMVEGVEQADPKMLPLLLGGERSGPPEDSGGLPGYQQVQDAYAGRPTDEWGRDSADCVRRKMGPDWTPETYDPVLIQARLARTWRGPRR